jgi:hypothetical protein
LGKAEENEWEFLPCMQAGSERESSEKKREIKMCNMKRLTFGLIYDGKESFFCCRRKILMLEFYVKPAEKGEGKVQQVDEIIVHMRQRSKKAWLIRLFLDDTYMVWKFYSYGSC